MPCGQKTAYHRPSLLREENPCQPGAVHTWPEPNVAYRGARVQRRFTAMIGTHIEIVLIVTGVLTATALLLFIAPLPTLRVVYGGTPKDLLTVALARHWGLLVFLVGVLLIYAGFHPAVRQPAVLLALIEKIALGVGVLSTPLRSRPVAATIALGDTAIAFVYF